MLFCCFIQLWVSKGCLVEDDGSLEKMEKEIEKEEGVKKRNGEQNEEFE